MKKAMKDDWVEISSIVLKPQERAAHIPPETAAVPLMMRCRGYALTEAQTGEAISIRTLAGRILSGTLESVHPAFDHGFGQCVTALMQIRKQLRIRETE
ncbi:MAG: 2-amino-4-ketopentanoate thiolase [Chitinivibrionales bacterium]|nr:2-amino-4-ketopentanoate thiolase [Chitinivibrionales bacterium]